MRALVTGAAGFLGRHLLRALHDDNHFVVALVRDFVQPNFLAATSPDAVVFGGFPEVERTIAEYEIDTVFHLAAQTQVSTAVADPVGTFEANVLGTVDVLDACRRQAVNRIVVASSDKAYGAGFLPYKEEQALAANGIYATSKTCGDFIAQAYAHEYGMNIAIVRCGNLYGPGHMNWSTLIPGTIRSVLKNERPRLRSDGGPKRDFLFVEDAVDGYMRLARTNTVGAFNFGTGTPHTVREVVAAILAGMDSDLVPIIAMGMGAVEIQDQYLSCHKALEVLDWKPQHSLAAGLAKTIDWYRLHLETLG